MADLKFYRNTRRLYWVAAESLWAMTADGRMHCVGADDSLVFEASELVRLMPWFKEVERPPNLRDDDLPFSE